MLLVKPKNGDAVNWCNEGGMAQGADGKYARATKPLNN